MCAITIGTAMVIESRRSKAAAITKAGNHTAGTRRRGTQCTHASDMNASVSVTQGGHARTTVSKTSGTTTNGTEAGLNEAMTAAGSTAATVIVIVTEIETERGTETGTGIEEITGMSWALKAVSAGGGILLCLPVLLTKRCVQGRRADCQAAKGVLR